MYDLEAIYNDSFSDELMKIAEEGEKKQSKGTAALAGAGIIGGATGVQSYLDYKKGGRMSKRKLVEVINAASPGAKGASRKQLASILKGTTHARNAGGALLAGGLLAGGLKKKKKYDESQM